MANETPGLLKREFVSVIDSRNSIEALSYIKFSPAKIEEYHHFFNQLKMKGVIVAETFDDRFWKLVDHNNNRSTVNFDLDLYPSYNLTLKCFTVLCMKEWESPRNFQGKLHHIKRATLATQGFSGDDVGTKLEDYFKSLSRSVLHKRTLSIAQFLVFFNHPLKDKLVEICYNFFPGDVQFKRELPNFKDVLLFDSILTDFQDKWSTKERLIYYPIFLWWRVTTVIPMRVTEFCSLAGDCAFTSAKGDYLLKVPRGKQRSSGENKLKIVDTLKINKEVYDMIQEYKELTRNFKSTPHLLSYEAYAQSDRVKRTHGNAFKVKINKDRFESPQLHSLIGAFYDEIIFKKYGYKNLEKIRPMDTRHYAFCNMMLQGFNMLSIAVIGGHSSLRPQMHYFQHLDHFSQSSVQFWADQFKKMPTISQSPEKSMLDGDERMVKLKSILNHHSEDDLKHLQKLEYGYCTFDPTRCPVGDCRHCEYFYIPQDEMNHEVYKWLSNESDRLKTRMKEQLTLMSKITQNQSYDFDSFEYDQQAQSELSYLASNSKKLIEQQAWTDARRDTIKDFLYGDESHDEKSR